jgi:hypothetical protein
LTLSDFILSANEIFQPVFLSSRCALVRSDDRNAIILFSTNAGLLFANSVKASGEAASIFFRKPILAYSPWASLLIVLDLTSKGFSLEFF